MAEPAVPARDDGAVRILTLNRPEARNALGAEMVAALGEALEAALAAREIEAVVLAGAGGAFCAGADLRALSALRGRSSAEGLEDSRALQALYLAMARARKPLVAAVDGPALAGGCGLAALCDFVLCTARSKFGYPEVKVGFVAAMVLVFLQRAVGQRRAQELLLSGRLVGAEEAVALGLAHRVTGALDPVPEAVEVARGFGAGAPSSLAWTKELLRRTWGLPLEDALEMAAQVNALARTGPDMGEGLEAFLAKRRPSWTRP